jgi:CheY-like chemotaxis protein
MDIQMPVLDGIGATKMMRESNHLSELPIIAMTAHAFEEEKKRCFDAGMNAHISKPIVPANLYETLAEWLKVDTYIQLSEEQGDECRSADSHYGLCLEDISMMDLSQALLLLGDSRELLTESLCLFAKDYAQATQALETLIEQSDLEGALRYAHTLKGLTATFAMSSLSQGFADIEKALSQPSLEGEPLVFSESFKQDFEEMIGLVSVFCAQNATEQSLSQADWSDVKSTLLAHLANFRGDSLDYFEAHRSLFEANLPVHLYRRLSNALQNIDFDEATKVIHET